MAENKAPIQTPSAGQAVENEDDDTSSGGTATLKITPTMLDILELFDAAGDDGLQQNAVKKAMKAKWLKDNPNGVKVGDFLQTLPPPIDTEMSALIGGLIEQVPDPEIKSKKNPEWIPGQWRITDPGREALATMRPKKAKPLERA